MWLAVVIGGGWFVHLKPDQPQPCTFVTERRLVPGFRLGDGDWSAPEGAAVKLTGKYANREYRSQEPLCADWLDDVPRVTLREGYRLVQLDVLTPRLNAGASVWLIRKDWSVDVPVMAVLCPQNQCNAIVVEVADKDFERVAAPPPPTVLVHTLP